MECRPLLKKLSLLDGYMNFSKFPVIVFCLIPLFINCGSLKAQSNLVPNPSFEDFAYCPGLFTTVNCADYWFHPWTLSADYFNACVQSSQPNNDVPKNVYSYQNAFDGDAYAGLFMLHYPDVPSFNKYKEYIQVQLTEPLVKNRRYCLEFYINFATQYNPGNGWIAYGVDHVGAYLSVDTPKMIGAPNLCYIDSPQVVWEDSVITETVDWVRVFGDFVAKGGERILTIGMFYETNEVTRKVVKNASIPYFDPTTYSYAFIDMVSVKYCDEDTSHLIGKVDSLLIPNVFTPNGDGFNDNFIYGNQEFNEYETQIFNRWGVLVYENYLSENWDGMIRGEKASSGVYFYIVKAKAIRNGKRHNYKGSVTILY